MKPQHSRRKLRRNAIRHVKTLCVMLVPVLNACAGQIVLGRDSNRAELDRINQTFRGRDTEVRLRDGRTYKVDGLTVSEDSVYWVGPDGEQFIPRSAFYSAEYETRSRGLWHGIAIGAGIGALVGAVGDCDGSYLCEGNQAEWVASMALGGAMWGALIGGLLGSKVQLVSDGAR